MKFKSKKEEQDAVDVLRTGAKSHFWGLIVKALEESKEYIQSQMDSEEMKNLEADQYKLMNELYKAKKEFLNILMKTPENIVSWLQLAPSERPKDFDPYD